MSLNYDLTNVKDRDTSEEGWQVTQCIIFGTMSTGIGDIKDEKVAEEFWIRYQVIIGDSSEVSLEAVKAHIGLKTNVFPEMTRHQWYKHLGKVMDMRLRDQKWRTRELKKIDAGA